MFVDEIKILIKINVERCAAEPLYDEVEAHLLILLEDVINRNSTSFSYLEQIFTPKALTEFLRTKFHQPLLDVQRVEIAPDNLTFGINFFVKLIVSNSWAVAYGKGSQTEELDNAISFFQNDKHSALIEQSKQTTINGEPVQPLIGSLCYDNLVGRMKLWDGNHWVAY